jgi:hypothetical protein
MMLKQIKCDGRYAFWRKDFSWFLVSKDGVEIKRFAMGSRDMAYKYYHDLVKEPDDDPHAEIVWLTKTKPALIERGKEIDLDGCPVFYPGVN